MIKKQINQHIQNKQLQVSQKTKLNWKIQYKVFSKIQKNQITQMKRPQLLSSDNSTQRIVLKPKLIQPKKQSIGNFPSTNNPIYNPNNKIMLTDLCPQQKAKIGQLIKTLQQRKLQNQQLSQHLTTYKMNFVQLQKRNCQLEFQIKQQALQINRLNEEVEKCNHEIINKDIELQQFRITVDKYKELAKLKELTISIGVETDVVAVVSKQVQTKEKRRKCKERQVQANSFYQVQTSLSKDNSGQRRNNLIMINSNNNTKNSNSKSFEKIMRMKQNLLPSQEIQLEYGKQQLRYQNNIISGDDAEKDGYEGQQGSQQGSEYEEGEKARLRNIKKENSSSRKRGYKNENGNTNIHHTSNNSSNDKNNNNINNNNWSKYSSTDHNSTSPNPPPTHYSHYPNNITTDFEQNPNNITTDYQQPPQSKSTNSNRLHPRDLIQVEDTQNDDDEFEMLARKWMELKEKNIRQLSEGWVQEETNRERNTTNGVGNSRKMMENSTRREGNSTHMSNNNSMRRKQPNNNNIHSTTTINPNQNPFISNISKTFETNNPHHPYQQQPASEQNQLIDQIQLNRALKSKDFSASKLLYNNNTISNMSRSKRRDSSGNALLSGEIDNGSDGNSRRLEMEKKGSGNVSMNSSNSNNLYKLSSNSNTNRTQPTSNFKPLTKQKHNPNYISGFYNEELLDLVEEINR